MFGRLRRNVFEGLLWRSRGPLPGGICCKTRLLLRLDRIECWSACDGLALPSDGRLGRATRHRGLAPMAAGGT